MAILLAGSNRSIMAITLVNEGERVKTSNGFMVKREILTD